MLHGVPVMVLNIMWSSPFPQEGGAVVSGLEGEGSWYFRDCR